MTVPLRAALLMLIAGLAGLIGAIPALGRRTGRFAVGGVEHAGLAQQ
jgi:hypothetical protein